MKRVPSQIALLFERHAALWGFSVRGWDQMPDSCARSAEEDALFVGDVSISPAFNAEQYDEIFQEVVAVLAEVLSEEPEAAEMLRGRTFVRVLH